MVRGLVVTLAILASLLTPAVALADDQLDPGPSCCGGPGDSGGGGGGAELTP